MTVATLLSGFEERVETIRGAPLRALVGGAAEGTPLVLLHGLGGSSANWALLAPRLAERRRVVLVDLPGHGRSGPLPAAPGIGAYADRIALLLERLSLGEVVAVGHSLGGLVALRLAARHPDAVSGLVLAAPAGIGSGTRAAERALAFVGWVQPGRRISRHWQSVARSGSLKRMVFGPWFAADPEALHPDAVEALLGELDLHTDTRSASRALTADDPRLDLHDVRCPALVLWGAEDRQLPVDDAFDYARRLRAPLRVIADCGHLPIVERPDACLDAIEEFLAP